MKNINKSKAHLPCSVIQWSIFFIVMMLFLNPAWGATIRLASDPVQSLGVEFRVDIMVDNADDLYGIALDLIYDSDKLEVVDADQNGEGVQPKISEGSLLNNGSSSLIKGALEDDLPGNLVLGVTRIGMIEGISVSSESLALSAYFVPKAAGLTTLTFIHHGLKQSTYGDLIISDPQQLEIEIEDWIGDVDHSEAVDLVDVILSLKAMAGIYLDGIFSDADVDGDHKIGLEEAVFAAQTVSGLRE